MQDFFCRVRIGAVCFRSCQSMFYSISFEPHAFSANGLSVRQWGSQISTSHGDWSNFQANVCKIWKLRHLCRFLIGLTWGNHISFWCHRRYNLWPAVPRYSEQSQGATKPWRNCGAEIRLVFSMCFSRSKCLKELIRRPQTGEWTWDLKVG